jgi:hypothetical protein
MSKTGRCSGHAVILGRLTGSMLALGLPESHIDDDLGGPVRVYGQFGSSRQLPEPCNLQNSIPRRRTAHQSARIPR